MSQSIFPTLISNTFIPALWTFPSSQITAEYLNSNFLKYPVGQGSETFPANVSVSGITSLGTTNISGATTATGLITANGGLTTGSGQVLTSTGTTTLTGATTASGGIRYTSPPMLSFRFVSAGSTQSILNGVNTDVIFPVTDGRNGTLTGITYDTGTGIFTNNNAYSVTLTLTAVVSYQSNLVGGRYLWIQHQGARVAISTIDPFSNAGELTTISVSASFVSTAGENTRIQTYQNSGSTLTISATTTFTSRVSVLVM